MATQLDNIRGLKDGLIRKMVSGGAMLLAPITRVVGPDFALTDDTGELKTQTGFYGLGRIARDGAPTFTPEDTTEEVDTWGELQASRIDITRSTLQVETTL